MNKFKPLGFRIFLLGIFLLPNFINAADIDGFPMLCSEANDRQALPGHILRLGMVNASYEGMYFSFPDQNDPSSLQQIGIADNVGLIGQNAEEDFSDEIKNGTPPGSFVVAQVFVADENAEPVVTCLSRAMPVTTYNPAYFGTAWTWLRPGIFIERLRWKRYRPWRWRNWYGSTFRSIRSNWRQADRDGDGIPDRLERRLRRDRDGDGIPDRLERRRNRNADRDNDGTPDRLERRRSLRDSDNDGTPDRLERRRRATQPRTTLKTAIQQRVDTMKQTRAYRNTSDLTDVVKRRVSERKVQRDTSTSDRSERRYRRDRSNENDNNNTTNENRFRRN